MNASCWDRLSGVKKFTPGALKLLRTIMARSFSPQKTCSTISPPISTPTPQLSSTFLKPVDRRWVRTGPAEVIFRLCRPTQSFQGNTALLEIGRMRIDTYRPVKVDNCVGIAADIAQTDPSEGVQVVH